MTVHVHVPTFNERVDVEGRLEEVVGVGVLKEDLPLLRAVDETAREPLERVEGRLEQLALLPHDVGHPARTLRLARRLVHVLQLLRRRQTCGNNTS